MSQEYVITASTVEDLRKELIDHTQKLRAIASARLLACERQQLGTRAERDKLRGEVRLCEALEDFYRKVKIQPRFRMQRETA